MSDRRNIDDDYKQAMIREWESYAASGRTEQAGHVAGVLLAEYDYDVHDDGQEKKEKAVEPPAAETTVESAPKETAVEPKPDTVRQAPAAAKKTTAKKTTAAPAKD
ncbi:hypothetical protein [Streptomyces sp. 3214.6]|uniref:hypothetical protein n=1 Tax=Streptomyces sp. 3214.6 TaxID=1882757 RepID=UPI00090A964C|nr:hypothetical protein [Streptomyces sp. 3214.6]SHI68220.1 hypothetical protein SAMN05444521_8224 [Streptomyces sp. 3214.6]